MHVTMIGVGGPIAPLAVLSTRAGHTVLRIADLAGDMGSCAHSQIVIVAGDRSALPDLIRGAASWMRADAIVIDATTSVDDEQGDDSDALVLTAEWMAMLPSTRVVKGFASVPVEAFTLIADRTSPGDEADLAVPMAGDDVQAKELVAEFMRQLGVEPFDLGPLTVSYVMEPGGPLWGKALDALDMSEAVGWLSGDG